MTERLTPLFSPPRIGPSSPLVSTDTTPRLDQGQLHVMTATIDHSGRVPAARLLRTLDWHPTHTTSAQLRGQAIVLRLDADSPHQINNRHQIFVPAGLRDLTGIRTSDTVVLLAAPGPQLLIIYSTGTLAALLRESVT